MLRYLRTVVMHFSFSKNTVFCGRFAKDELVPSDDLHFSRFVVKCVSRVRVCDQSKHSNETRAERGGERRVWACKLPPILVVGDPFATGTNIGYYLGRKLNSNQYWLLFWSAGY